MQRNLLQPQPNLARAKVKGDLHLFDLAHSQFYTIFLSSCELNERE